MMPKITAFHENYGRQGNNFLKSRGQVYFCRRLCSMLLADKDLQGVVHLASVDLGHDTSLGRPTQEGVRF